MAKRALLKNQLQTLGTLKRIQDQRKREAQLALLESQEKGEQQRELVRGWEQRLETQEQHRARAQTPADLLQHSQFRMRAEMHRRRSIQTLQDLDRDISERREDLTREVRESKTLERLMEKREEMIAEEHNYEELQTMDEVGGQTWWSRRARGEG